MTKIRIAVAYHKNGIFADNELFIPVQVGATFAKQELGIQKDSEEIIYRVIIRIVVNCPQLIGFGRT